MTTARAKKKFKRYPKLKDSGIEWLGEIPAGWEVKRLKHLAQLRSGESINGEQITPVGEYPVYGGNGIRGYTESYTHEGHYCLIGRQGALCGNINYAKGKFWASEHAVVASPVIELDVFWFGGILCSMNLNQYSVTAAQPGLSVDTIKNLFLPLPPLSEQRAIAAYLDRETAKIDALTAKIVSHIEKLREYRQALISAAVTGKIDVREEAKT